jgi:hypothetical protein
MRLFLEFFCQPFRIQLLQLEFFFSYNTARLRLTIPHEQLQRKQMVGSLGAISLKLYLLPAYSSLLGCF